MNRLLKSYGVLMFLSLFLCSPLFARDIKEMNALSPSSYCADSIMNNIFFYAPFYESAVQEYDSDLYIKTNIDIKRKNFTFRYIPQMFKPVKDVRNYIVESYNEIHYTAPNIFDHKVKAITGTTPRFKGVFSSIRNYFNINIYSPSFFSAKLVSPLHSKFAKYYKYTLEEVYRGINGLLEFKIKFEPRNVSYQLVSGYLIVSEKVWSIREIEFRGRSEYLSATCVIKLGEVGAKDEFLPLSYNIDATLRFLWNKVRLVCDTRIKYDKIILKKNIVEEKKTKSNRKVNKYDLSESYTFQLPDTTKIAQSYSAFEKLRFTALSVNEYNLYKDFHARKDSVSILATPQKSKLSVFWSNVGDFLIEDYKLGLENAGTIRFSPLLNPFLLSYNGRDGFSYKYKIRYNHIFKNGKSFRFNPTFGYNFKNKEFYWKNKTEFIYWPQKRAGIELDMNNGNRIYSSEVLDDLKGKTDTIDFKGLNLDYYRNMHLDLMHVLEVVNGVNVDVGLSVSRRKNSGSAIPDSLNLDDKIKRRYVSVAPRVRLKWTPGQYYYMNENRKINLHSKYPTLTLDWERSIKGFLGATGNHERFEIDLQHQFSLGMLRKVFYRLGGGMFTNQEQMYFVDFVYFAKNNLPDGWADDIGGTFQLLRRDWFNASQWYVRGHLVYESPFIALRHLSNYSRSVINERIYINALVMNQLKPYVEIGYGIGTHIFDFGVFGALSNWKNSKIGCKITFELFSK